MEARFPVYSEPGTGLEARINNGFKQIIYVALVVPILVQGYSWPDHDIDSIEAILYQQKGFDAIPFVVGTVTPCDSDIFGTTGRTVSAEWFRTAYHDMATANVTAGTGGIDASIGFESDRPENVGKFINSTLLVFSSFQSATTSMADLIALGTTIAIGVCSNGSIIVPFSAGRIDATEAGPAGVPQPQDPLETHIADFKRQGFTPDEMIALVACGHTLGGVHGVDFPTIVPDLNETGNENRVNFDESVASYDNSVAVQFVQNVTQNPLAFGPNVTTRSDFRIFTSDGGATIAKMAESNEAFFEMCTPLLERMLNTVPNTVTLYPVAPILVKPSDVALSVNDNGTLTFSGKVRLLEGEVASAANPPNVTIHYVPRSGLTCTNCTAPATTSESMTAVSVYNNTPTFRFYQWSTMIPISAGISAFSVEVIHGKETRTYENEDGPFPFQDLLVVEQGKSCMGEAGAVSSDGQRSLNISYSMTASIIDAAELQNVTFTAARASTQPNSMSFRFTDESVAMTRGAAIGDTGYTTYTIDYSYIINLGTTPTTPTFTSGITATYGNEAIGNPYLTDLLFCQM